MTVQNTSLITRPSTPSVSTTTDYSVPVPIAYMLHSVFTVIMVAYWLSEDPQLGTATPLQISDRQQFAIKAASGVTVLDIMTKVINYEKGRLSKEKCEIKYRIKHKFFLIEETVICATKGAFGFYLLLRPFFNEEIPPLPKISATLFLSAISDIAIIYSEKTIPEFFGLLIKRIDRCRARLIQPLSLRSTIAATRSAAQTALASSSQPDSRCRRIYNGVWSVMTACVNGVKRGFSCKRRAQ